MGLSDLLNAQKLGAEYSAQELAAALKKLERAKNIAQERERREQWRREREERERQAREERERQETHVREVTSMDLPLDWNNAFASDPRAQSVHADSIPDGLILSLTTLGRVDIEYISAITGADCKTVIQALRGSIYQNPETWGECFYKGWETAEEYLSGNLVRKWKAANAANRTYAGYFFQNLEAIRKALPPAVATEDIYITLGSPWVPADVIDDFIQYLFGEPRMISDSETKKPSPKATVECYRTIHDEITGTWNIPEKSYRYGQCHVGITQTYGTERMGALHILEKTLNMKTVAVTDEVSCPTNASGKKRVVNQGETMTALEKQKRLIDAFQKWVWTDPTRKKRLEDIFRSQYGSTRRRNFDGSFLTFPTMSPNVTLYPYQKNAVARIIFSPNTLLAHDVGAGKTYEMIAAGQELRRMGLSKKNMYVVPNNLVGQWRNIFLTMYPAAHLLCIEPKSFTPGKREKVLEQIRDEDFDGIIIAYSCFERIPLSKEYYEEELNEKLTAISAAVAQKSKATSRLKQKEWALKVALQDLIVAQTDLYDRIYFDELGVTRLFVDEAHNFKNVPVETQTTNVLGISTTGSKKCRDMMDKVHMLQRKNNGGGVVFATGTPITNSVTDVYIMQRYLQSGELALLDLQSFDSWLGMFAERTTEFEIDVDTSGYRLATRFSKFHNLPELTALMASVADFHQLDRKDGLPQTDGYHDVVVGKTPEFAAYLKDISNRAEAVRNGLVSRCDDNMLKITTDGRKAALDMRLVDPASPFTDRSKAARCAENVADLYWKTMQTRSTQLIFCDTSTPKAGFNLYDELKERLVRLGVAEDRIAFVHDADTEGEKSALFAAVRAGQVRVLIGSTFKLGLGVNVQDKLFALHHIDVPWRPADMIQREGRILRRGNENETVHIFRYITEGSFDAYSWQLLETKQRMIAGILSGSLSARSGSDVENTVLNYAEVKALAVGDPRIKERVEAANGLTRYMVLQRKQAEARQRMEQELSELPAHLQNQREAVSRCGEDLADYLLWKAKHPPAMGKEQEKAEQEKRRAIRVRLNDAMKDCPRQKEEAALMRYRGFDVILPAHMLPEKPYIWLQGKGRYYVELGGTEVGDLLRVDHFLDGLEGYLDDLKQGLSHLEKRESDLKIELEKQESYADKIGQYREKVEKLDRELGVDQI